MELGLRDRVVAVGGSSRGIGLAIARGALAEGARVGLSGRDGDSLEQAAEQLREEHPSSRLHAVRCDLATDDGARMFVEDVEQTLAGIDALVLNAGTGAFRTGWETDVGDWEAAFAANLWPAQHVLEHALPRMVARRQGAVVIVVSITGMESTGAPIPYGAAKAALVATAKNLARALGETGVRVNCIAPGNVLFEGGRWEQRVADDPDGVRSLIEAEVPMKRFGTPQEVADGVLFLLSDRASFITGTCLVVDGGQTRGFR